MKMNFAIFSESLKREESVYVTETHTVVIHEYITRVSISYVIRRGRTINRAFTAP